MKMNYERGIVGGEEFINVEDFQNGKCFYNGNEVPTSSRHQRDQDRIYKLPSNHMHPSTRRKPSL